jgi:hypothetical protein
LGSKQHGTSIFSLPGANFFEDHLAVAVAQPISFLSKPNMPTMFLDTLAINLYPSAGLSWGAAIWRLGCIFLVAQVGWIVYCRFFHPLSGIPGPFLASFSRTWIGMAVAGGRAEHLQRSLHKHHGPLVRIAHDEVSVADPSAVKVIYNIKSGFTKTDFYPPLAPNISPHGDHFAQIDEAKHAERRKYVNAVYSMSTILESETYIDACTDVFLESMGRFAETGSKIDFGEWIQW